MALRPPAHLQEVTDEDWPMVFWAIKHVDEQSHTDPRRHEVTYKTDSGPAWARACESCVKAGEPCLVDPGIRCLRCKKAGRKCGAAGMCE